MNKFLTPLLRLLLLVLLVETIYLCFTSPYLKSQNIEIKGLRTLRRSQILAKIGVPLGINLFKVNLRQIRLKIEEYPKIKSASVIRLLPNTIKINITERKPYAQIKIVDKFIILDEEGICFGSSIERIKDLTIIDCIFPGKIELGQKMGNQIPVSCLKIFKPKIEVAKVTVDEKNHVTITTPAAMDIFLGKPEDLKIKALMLATTLKVIKGSGKKAKYIDLRIPEAPAWLPGD